MYPWYRDTQIGVGQFCNPMTTIKTESGYNDCMLALDYAAQSKVSTIIIYMVSSYTSFNDNYICMLCKGLLGLLSYSPYHLCI